MALVTLLDGQLAYGELPLLDRAAFSMEAGERIGLIGRNGTGKSSLLSVIAGKATLDDGEVRLKDGTRVVLVDQEPVLSEGGSFLKHKFEEFLHRFSLDADRAPDTMSGGERKRMALAKAFALEPDLLLLDEPTNHLDIDGILALENLLMRIPSAIVITHDRAFLDRVATRILELDRGQLYSFPGNFTRYEQTKAAQLVIEAVANRKFDKFWAEEEIWIRKGVPARTTRNEGRVRRLERLREERAARRERSGNVRLTLGSGQRSGKLVCELQKVNISFGDRPIVKDLDLIVSRGDRLGLVGPNGAGKTTLLNLILGTLAPDSGHVRLGTNVQVAYFDQMREGLDPEKTLAENIDSSLPGGKHVMSYLGDFLFPPRRAQSPVRMLSGGERNRLLLARLFARPANVLVLDEPTNDLDIESLELLEAALQDYDGTLLLVSHDRAFLDNVITQTLAPLGDGRWKEYAGGYSDWLRQRPAASQEKSIQKEARAAAKARIKLSYKETRELAALPGEIAALEAEAHALTVRMNASDYYRQPPDVLRGDKARAGEIEDLLNEKLERWTALESKG
jgi:ATP-binding cassette subfamily F protein uup